MNFIHLNILKNMGRSKNILKEANEIIFGRKQEKHRDYGPIDESMEDTATIASILTGKDLTAEDCYKVMAALKMARMKKSYKRDTYLDCVAYLGALDAYLEKEMYGEDEADILLDKAKEKSNSVVNKIKEVASIIYKG